MPWFSVPVRREETHIQLGDIRIEADSEEDALLCLKLGSYEEDNVEYSSMTFETSTAWEYNENYPVDYLEESTGE